MSILVLEHPPRPKHDCQIPTFADARRLAKDVMTRLGRTSLEVWVLYGNDEVGLHRFNRNGSHKRITKVHE